MTGPWSPALQGEWCKAEKAKSSWCRQIRTYCQTERRRSLPGISSVLALQVLSLGRHSVPGKSLLVPSLEHTHRMIHMMDLGDPLAVRFTIIQDSSSRAGRDICLQMLFPPAMCGSEDHQLDSPSPHVRYNSSPPQPFPMWKPGSQGAPTPDAGHT